MTAPNARGALIVVEGLDRAGKSTQVERLCSNLEKEGRKVKHIRFPDRTTAIGQSINAYLQNKSHVDDHVIHLLFSANRWEAAKALKADIEAGITLVVDRYSYSGAVYSAAKDNPELSLDWAWLPEIGLPRPDVCVFLTVSPEIAKSRGGYGEEKYENDHMQGRVRELYDVLFRREGEGHILRVNADETIDTVEKVIIEGVNRFITTEVLIRPLTKLEILKPLVQR